MDRSNASSFANIILEGGEYKKKKENLKSCTDRPQVGFLLIALKSKQVFAKMKVFADSFFQIGKQLN